jgi:hypothetical protein
MPETKERVAGAVAAVGGAALVGLGLYLYLRRTQLKVQISWERLGGEQAIWAGVGLARSRSWYELRQFGPLVLETHREVSQGDDPNWKQYSMNLNAALPKDRVPDGIYDAFVFLHTSYGEIDMDPVSEPSGWEWLVPWPFAMLWNLQRWILAELYPDGSYILGQWYENVLEVKTGVGG